MPKAFRAHWKVCRDGRIRGLFLYAWYGILQKEGKRKTYKNGYIFFVTTFVKH